MTASDFPFIRLCLNFVLLTSARSRWVGNSYTARREKIPPFNLSELGRLIPFMNEMNCVVLILARNS